VFIDFLLERRRKSKKKGENSRITA